MGKQIERKKYIFEGQNIYTYIEYIRIFYISEKGKTYEKTSNTYKI